MTQLTQLLAAVAQVGNAVPPPLSRAIGLEIKKCVIQRMKEEPTLGNSLVLFVFIAEIKSPAFIKSHSKTLYNCAFPSTDDVKQEKMDVSD